MRDGAQVMENPTKPSGDHPLQPPGAPCHHRDTGTPLARFSLVLPGTENVADAGAPAPFAPSSLGYVSEALREFLLKLLGDAEPATLRQAARELDRVAAELTAKAAAIEDLRTEARRRRERREQRLAAIDAVRRVIIAAGGELAPEALAAAIAEAAEAHDMNPTGLAAAVKADRRRWTRAERLARDQAIARMALVEGRSTREIANMLTLAERTIERVVAAALASRRAHPQLTEARRHSGLASSPIAGRTPTAEST